MAERRRSEKLQTFVYVPIFKTVGEGDEERTRNGGRTKKTPAVFDPQITQKLDSLWNNKLCARVDLFSFHGSIIRALRRA